MFVIYVDGAENDGERKDKLRMKPLSGTLYVSVKGAHEVDHAPVVASRSRSASKVIETYVSIKVEGTQLAKSHPSRTDKWNEDFEISVDKANEVEIVVYDKQVSEPHPIPIGLLWIRITDLVDALRRQKIGMDGQGGWVTAGAMPGDTLGGMPMQSPSGDMNAPLGFGVGPSGGVPSGPSGQSDGIDAWFAVEPAGAIQLHLNFSKLFYPRLHEGINDLLKVKENVRKRPLDGPLGGLGRQGAVRKRKGEVHEMNGHKFVQRQFYQLMLCAFCNDFILNALGYQCEDCRYTCHKKCYEKVVTKCISKSNTGVRILILWLLSALSYVQEGDEEKINHRIPHRFEPLTNIGANWCCHCGYMLPLGRKNARKCSECDITCHANCAHLVPDFCGMSMETANELLRNWRDINRARGDKAQVKPAVRQYSDYHISSQSLDSTLTGLDKLKISSPEAASSSDPFSRPTSLPPTERFQPDPRYYQPPPAAAVVPPYGQQPPPANRPPPRVVMSSGYAQGPNIQGQIPGQQDSAVISAVVDNGYGSPGYQVI